MDIVIISEFCEDFSASDNDRFLFVAKMLTQQNDVEIVTSSFRHTTKSHRTKPVASWPFGITFIDEPGYSKNVCLKRFASHFIWGRNVAKHLKSRKTPHVVYCAVPSLIAANRAAKYCKKNSVRFVIDVQDLWPEAFKMAVNIPVISSIGFWPLKELADNVYRAADAICAVSESYAKRALAVNEKCDDGAVVFLGTDLQEFDQYANCALPIKKNPNEVWIAYCGTLGASYDLTCVIDALANVDSPVIFFVMGDGPRRAEFETRAQEKGIAAVFTGRLEYGQMCCLLSSCDIAVNPIAHNAAQSIINKHADYVAAGLPIVSTQESEEFKSLVDDYKMGFNCKNGDPDDVADKIGILIKDEGLRKTMAGNARRCAEEKFDRRSSYKLLVNAIVGKSAGILREQFRSA